MLVAETAPDVRYSQYSVEVVPEKVLNSALVLVGFSWYVISVGGWTVVEVTYVHCFGHVAAAVYVRGSIQYRIVGRWFASHGYVISGVGSG